MGDDGREGVYLLLLMNVQRLYLCGGMRVVASPLDSRERRELYNQHTHTTITTTTTSNAVVEQWRLPIFLIASESSVLSSCRCVSIGGNCTMQLNYHWPRTFQTMQRSLSM